MLGKFSALAVSDSIVITSVCNGIKTQYLMYKDGLSIKIDEILSEPSTDKNGVEILAYLTNAALSNYIHYLKSYLASISFFSNLYVDCKITNSVYDCSKLEILRLQDTLKRFNERKIEINKYYSFCDFSGSSFRDTMSVKYGKVVYPINWEKLPFSSWIHSLPIVVNIDIGNLDVTPNREQLLYSKKTVDALKTAIENAVDEFSNDLSKRFDTELSYKNLIEFFGPNVYSDRLIGNQKSNVYTQYKDMGISISSDVYSKCYSKLMVDGKQVGAVALALVNDIFEHTTFRIIQSKSRGNVNFSSKQSNDVLSFKDILSNTLSDAERIAFYLWKENIKSGTKNYLSDICNGKNIYVVKLDTEATKDILLKRYLTTKATYGGIIAKQAMKIAIKLMKDYVKNFIPELLNSNTPESYFNKSSIQKASTKNCQLLRIDKYSNRVLTTDLANWAPAYEEDNLFLYGTSNEQLLLEYASCISASDVAKTYEILDNKQDSYYQTMRVVKISKAGIALIKDKSNWKNVSSFFDIKNSYWLKELQESVLYYREVSYYYEQLRKCSLFSAMFGNKQLSKTIDSIYNTVKRLTKPTIISTEEKEFFNRLLNNLPKLEPKTIDQICGIPKEDFERINKLSSISIATCIDYVMNKFGCKEFSLGHKEELNKLKTLLGDA